MDGRLDLGAGLEGRRRNEKKGDPSEPLDHALGRSRGGFSTKLHLVCDGRSLPLSAHLSAGQRHDSSQFEELMSRTHVHTAGPGRPRTRPSQIVADRGSGAWRIRHYLRRRGIRTMIPERRPAKGRKRRRRGRPPVFDKKLYAQRNMIERMIGGLKENRRLGTRFKKKATHFLTMVKLAFIRQYLKTCLSHTA